MNLTKLFLFVIAAIIATTTTTTAFAQSTTTPPPLEPEPAETSETTTTTETSLGKVTIQISQTEQIVIDLPLKSDNTYQIVPIK